MIFLGNGLNILKMFPEGAIKFGTYEVSSTVVSRSTGTKHLHDYCD